MAIFWAEHVVEMQIAVAAAGHIEVSWGRLKLRNIYLKAERLGKVVGMLEGVMTAPGGCEALI